MLAELDLIVRLQEYVRSGTAAARYHGPAAGQQALQPARPGDVVRVHVRVHCNIEKDYRRAKTPVIVTSKCIIDKRKSSPREITIAPLRYVFRLQDVAKLREMSCNCLNVKIGVTELFNVEDSTERDSAIDADADVTNDRKINSVVMNNLKINLF